MAEPAISVAMSVYNNADYLALAIESILAQTHRDFEFLILNDGSTDASGSIIDSYAARDSRIRPIHRENKGLITSLNQLVAESRAPLIARMDGDDISQPERFARQLAFLNAHPDYGVVGTWTRDIDGKGEVFPLSGADHPTDHEGFLRAIESGPLLCHPSAMIRRALLVQVGGYHAAFKHCEDYDLWLRLAGITRLCSIPERLVHYRHTDSQVSNRHIVTQQTNSSVALIAWQERCAGRPDPTEHLDTLPPIEQLDALFGRAGVSDQVIAMTAPGLLYSQVALTSPDGFGLVRRHINRSGASLSLWRTVARLGIRMGEWGRASALAQALLLATI